MTWVLGGEASPRMAATTSAASFAVTTDVAIPAFALAALFYASDGAGTNAYPAIPAASGDVVWTMGNRTQAGTGGMSACYWAYCPTGIPSGTVITSNAGASTTNRSLICAYFTGGSRWSGFLDASNAANSTGSTTPGASATAVRANGLVLGTTTDFGASANTFTPTAGYTQLGARAYVGVFAHNVVYKLAGLQGSNTPGGTISVSAKWNATAAIFLDNIVDVVVLDSLPGMLASIGAPLR